MAKLNQSKLSREDVDAVFRALPESTRESLRRERETRRLIQHLMATLAKNGSETIGRDEILSALESWVGPGECQHIQRLADGMAEETPATVVARAG